MNLGTGFRFARSNCLRRPFSSHGTPSGVDARLFPKTRPKDSGLYEVINGFISEGRPTPAGILTARRETTAKLKKQNRAADLQKYQLRSWKEGDVYSPHDLSSVEMVKWRRRHPNRMDAFDALGINPLHEYKNPSIIWEYTTAMGRIKHRKETGLRPVNQRRIAKAIRRAVGMGLMPSVHNHPEVLEAEAQKMALRVLS